MIIFLDIDGVLNGGWHPDFDFDWTRPEAVAAFNRIVSETGAQVVISSSWRLENTLAEIVEFLTGQGVEAEFIGVTPEIGFETEWEGAIVTLPDARIKEIRAWLNEHIEVENIVVLDDQDIRLDVNNDVKSDPEIEVRWVQPIHEVGLTENHADLAISILQR